MDLVGEQLLIKANRKSSCQAGLLEEGLPQPIERMRILNLSNRQILAFL